MKRYTKILAPILCLCLLLSSLSACSSKPTDEQIRAETAVGTVGDMEVTYDELYFLAKNYRETVKELTGGDPTAMQTELDRLVKEHIVTNFAILKLCEQTELDYKKGELRRDAKKEVSALIESSFGNDRSLYEESLAEAGLTERYLLYTTEVDLMYGRLLSHYPEQGLVSDDEAEIRAYIQKNFIRTVHVMNPDYEQISRAHAELTAGTMTMHEAIGSIYNKDFNSISGNGYYFAPGTMEEEYEKVAFALEPGEISSVVTAMGEVNGLYETCYYIIQRLSPDESYITENLSLLQTQYYESVIYGDMEKIRAGLTFTPNEFYDALTLAELPVPYEPSALPLILLCVGGGIALLTAAITVPVVLTKKKHAKKNLAARRSA